jgi:hypothetical protein
MHREVAKAAKKTDILWARAAKVGTWGAFPIVNVSEL